MTTVCNLVIIIFRGTMESLSAKRAKAKRLDLEKKVYETTAKVALKYGHPGLEGYTDRQLAEFWTYDTEPPCRENFKKKTSVNQIKKVINSAIRIDHNIWNSDFLHGLATNCELVNRNDNFFQSLIWRNNANIDTIVLASPFGGKIGKNLKENKPEKVHRWSYVPAFDLTYTKYTTSFVAGLLAGGKIVYKDKAYFSRHSGDAIEEIKKLKIPIEKELRIKSFNYIDHYVLISPLWAALFSRKMPKEVRAKWFGIEKAYNAQLYSAILWRTYVDSSFRKGGIPYLKSRRMIFYEFKCEEGAMVRLEKLRFDMKLSQLDYSVRDIVKEWANNPQKSV